MAAISKLEELSKLNNIKVISLGAKVLYQKHGTALMMI